VSRWCILLLLLAAACDRTQTVTVVASIPGLQPAEGPTPGFAFVALPYDRDSLVAAFEARAASPKPATAALDSLFERYRAPFAAYTTVVAEAGRFGDSLTALRQRLDTMSRTSPAYNESYREWTKLRDTLDVLDKKSARARADLEAARPKFAAESDSLRAMIRHWEDSTFKGYDTAAGALVKASHHEAVADTTGPDGTAVLRLRGGPWWISARSWDPTDPNAQWYWNVKVSSDTVVLDATTGINRPRY